MKPTQEELKQWEEEKARHDAHYEAIKPVRGDFETEAQYKIALNKWMMDWSCFSPNKPGYYRAAND